MNGHDNPADFLPDDEEAERERKRLADVFETQTRSAAESGRSKL